MTRILVIDDELINHQMVARALDPLQSEMHFATTGREGITAAKAFHPDVIITDVVMPDINGYEVTRILRRELQFAATPILILTAQTGLQDKIKSFEAGADDHITKPFDPAELTARVNSLLRRIDAAKAALAMPIAPDGARMIAVQSLRGGIGSSTLAVNLAVSFAGLWRKPSILLDLTMTAGQCALMLNLSLRRTWTDIAHFNHGELDSEALQSIISVHESGLSCIAAPTFPSEAESLTGETMRSAMQLIKDQFDYVVADLPHDFSDPAVQALDLADCILLVAAPDVASIRAVAAALDTYDKLGYPKDRIKLVLNAIFPHSSISREKIAAAIGFQPAVSIPYVQDLFVDAINLGQPPVYFQPEEHVSGLLEDFAFLLSKDTDKKEKPENPTETWKRVYKRYQSRKK